MKYRVRAGTSTILKPRAWALIAIAAAVLLANLPYLLDFSDPNPLGPRSGLLASVIPGPASGQPTIDPNNGFISQAVSHRAAVELLHLHLPWWNPYEGTGAPLAGELQAAALFVPTLLTAFGNGQLYEHILLELIAGFSTYALLRRLSLGQIVAVAGGIAFALNGTFAWLSHATVNPVAFLPLLLLGIELAYAAATEGLHGSWWLIAVAGAGSFYAGFPEVAYIDALLAICWFAWRVGCCSERPHRVALLAKGGLGAAVGVMLSAPLLIAMIDYFNHADLGRHASSYFASGHIPGHGSSQLVLPYIFGPIFGYVDPKLTLTSIWGTVGGYLSTSLLLFALVGLLSRRLRALKMILLAWCVLALSRMYGVPVLWHVLGILPGMPRVAFFRYATASVELSVIVLAAVGLDGIAREPLARRRAVWIGIGALTVVVIAAIAAHPLADQLGSKFSRRPYFAGAIAWGAAVIVAGLVISVTRVALRRRILVGALVALDALLLFAAPEASAPRAVQLDLAPVSFLQRNLGLSRAFTLGPLQPNYGTYFGVALLNINDVPVPSAFASYIHRRLDPVVDPTVFTGNLAGGRPVFAPTPAQELVRNLAGYRAAAVKYVLAPSGQRLPFPVAFRSPTTWIYQLPGSDPYFTAPGCLVRARSRTVLDVSCTRPATLVRRETGMSGWSASVDGGTVPVGRVDGLWQTVALPAGSHHVVFSYAPPNIGWGLAAFALGAVVLFAAPARRRIRRRASAPAQASAG